MFKKNCHDMSWPSPSIHQSIKASHVHECIQMYDNKTLHVNRTFLIHSHTVSKWTFDFELYIRLNSWIQYAEFLAHVWRGGTWPAQIPPLLCGVAILNIKLFGYDSFPFLKYTSRFVHLLSGLQLCLLFGQESLPSRCKGPAVTGGESSIVPRCATQWLRDERIGFVPLRNGLLTQVA